jgi:hypothetical protein
MKQPSPNLLTAAGALLALAWTASAQITGYDLGTDAPPTDLGGYTFTVFPADPTPINTVTYSIASPLGGDLVLETDLLPPYSYHLAVGQGWATWSHGYTGDVYSDNVSHGFTITLPPSTGAFYFYAEPNPQYPVPVEVTADETTPAGTSISTLVSGLYGANGFAFVAPAGSTITTIRLYSLYGIGVGEFGIAAAVPEPGSSAVAVAAGLMTMAGVRRFYNRGQRTVAHQRS